MKDYAPIENLNNEIENLHHTIFDLGYGQGRADGQIEGFDIATEILKSDKATLQRYFNLEEKGFTKEQIDTMNDVLYKSYIILYYEAETAIAKMKQLQKNNETPASDTPQRLSKAEQDKIKLLPRYRDFIFEYYPTPFNELFVDEEFDIVQVHSLQPAGDDIVGFCGSFIWKKNTLTPCDGDSYNEEMHVYAYKHFKNKRNGIEHGLDILVNEDW